MKASEVVSAGNSFGIPFIVAFVFIYFAIVDPHYARDTWPEQHMENTLHQIEMTEGQLQEKLSRIRDRNDEIRMPVARSLREDKPRITTRPPRSPDQIEKAEDSEIAIREKLVQLGMAHQSLSKAKSEKKDYSIPLISVSINEETLLRFFPLLVVLGLVRLLFFRSTLLRSMPSDSKEFIPIWAAPVPFGATQLPFSSWVGVNLSGFAVAGSIVFLLLRFVLLYARENKASSVLALKEIALIGVWAFIYLVLVVTAIRHKCVEPLTERMRADTQ